MAKKKTKEKPPVVVVLGHVDHGKSSLLEAVKDLKITASESGGITQHIGAYMVSHQGKNITFIDTPGHEAFFAMRSRGARTADVGVLVVAADESIKEQTKEAIRHLKETEMPFVVAINKIDKKNIDIERVKQDLSKEDVFVEDYGGSVPSANVSAKKKTGIDDLLEIITLLAEVEGKESKEDIFEGLAEGVILETKRDNKKGVIANLLVKKGTLKKGDIVATGSVYGKVKSMEDFLGNILEEAGVSTPVQVTGFKECPCAGEDFFCFEKADEAKKFATQKKEKCEQDACSKGKKNLNIVLKADVAGSLEAIESSLKKLPQEEIVIKIVKSGIGNITDTDIDCLKSQNAGIFGFNVGIDKSAERVAIRDGIEIKIFNIIYELIDSVKEEAEKILGEEVVREEIGKVDILAVFRTQKNRQILGGKTVDGVAKKGVLVEIHREGEKIGEGKLVNVKKEEKDMEQIREGEEFGMLLESKEKSQEGDQLILYKEEKVKKKL